MSLKRRIKHIELQIEENDVKTLKNVNSFKKAFVNSNDNKGPPNWTDVYNEIVEMRNKISAPVDSKGCQFIPLTLNKNMPDVDKKVYRFQILFSLMLSSQTRDEVIYETVKNLHEYFLKNGYKNGLCLNSILDTDQKLISEKISKVGFYNLKAKYIKKTCVLLRDSYTNDVPKTISDLLKLPGIGKKMGYLILQHCWNINIGIGVDVHLHRISRVLNWSSENATTPEKTRLELQSWLPKSFWPEINPLIVGFGQSICVANKLYCNLCTLKKKNLCPNPKITHSNTEFFSKLKKLKSSRVNLIQLL